MRNCVLVSVMLFAVACFAACVDKSAQPSAKSSVAPAAAKPAWPGKMALTTDPAQPKSDADTTFRVTLTDEAGKPVSGATINADLKMELMDMGKNTVALADKGNGVYEGKGRFTMTGPWAVVVSASKEGRSGTQQFEITLRE